MKKNDTNNQMIYNPNFQGNSLFKDLNKKNNFLQQELEQYKYQNKTTPKFTMNQGSSFLPEMENLEFKIDNERMPASKLKELKKQLVGLENDKVEVQNYLSGVGQKIESNNNLRGVLQDYNSKRDTYGQKINLPEEITSQLRDLLKNNEVADYIIQKNYGKPSLEWGSNERSYLNNLLQNQNEVYNEAKEMVKKGFPPNIVEEFVRKNKRMVKNYQARGLAGEEVNAAIELGNIGLNNEATRVSNQMEGMSKYFNDISKTRALGPGENDISRYIETDPYLNRPTSGHLKDHLKENTHNVGLYPRYYPYRRYAEGGMVVNSNLQGKNIHDDLNAEEDFLNNEMFKNLEKNEKPLFSFNNNDVEKIESLKHTLSTIAGSKDIKKLKNINKENRKNFLENRNKYWSNLSGIPVIPPGYDPQRKTYNKSKNLRLVSFNVAPGSDSVLPKDEFLFPLGNKIRNDFLFGAVNKDTYRSDVKYPYYDAVSQINGVNEQPKQKAPYTNMYAAAGQNAKNVWSNKYKHLFQNYPGLAGFRNFAYYDNQPKMPYSDYLIEMEPEDYFRNANLQKLKDTKNELDSVKNVKNPNKDYVKQLNKTYTDLLQEEQRKHNSVRSVNFPVGDFRNYEDMLKDVRRRVSDYDTLNDVENRFENAANLNLSLRNSFDRIPNNEARAAVAYIKKKNQELN